MSKYIKLEDAFKAVRDNTMPLDCGHIDRMRAIADLPTIEVSEDCISKASVISALSLYRNLIETELAPRVSAIKDIVLGTTDDCIELVGKAPSVVPSRPEGEWEITGAYPHNVYCSECHNKFAQTHWAVWEDGSLPRNYCPACGARMKG